jgi:chemotaxis protein MotB
VARARVEFARCFKGLVAGLALVGGCGVSQELFNTRTTELDHCQSDLNHSQRDLTAARAKGDDLTSETDHLRDRVTTLENDRVQLARNLSATKQEMDELRRAHVQAEQRSELFRTLVTKLRAMIDSRTLAVEIRKGKMLVKLGDQILFDPGKAELKPDGQTALRQVAAALKEIPDRDFLIAGHTDNQPIKNSPYRSNWELSTSRAVNVVRFLQSEGVDPRRLAAAGYSEFDAVAENSSTDARAQNRRIEIVVMPNLDELPSIDPKIASPPDGGVATSPDAAPAPPTPAAAPLPAPAPPRR